MKNSERIEKLEKQVQVLMNRVALLEMKANPLVPAAAPVEWPKWQPTWMLDPEVNKYAIMCTGPGTGKVEDSAPFNYGGDSKFPPKSAYRQ